MQQKLKSEPKEHNFGREGLHEMPKKKKKKNKKDDKPKFPDMSAPVKKRADEDEDDMAAFRRMGKR